MSSRENFVICVDYSTNKIKWILGDPSKAWHDYPSLRRYALTLATGSQPPIGQHAVSISGDNLLLFDDGANSFNQSPAGDNRDYSACRKYRIDTRAMRATEIWNYTADRKIYSPYCSSIYEDRPRNYLVDYAVETDGTTELVGLDSRGAKAFDYKYTTQAFCGTSWNALPIHWESLKFR